MTQEEFSRAAQTYGDMIYRVAYHALGCREDAEDVMQTVLLRLFEQKAEFESEDHMKHWLLRVSVNESRKMLRSFWRRTAVPLEEWHELTAPEDRERAELMGAVMALEPKYRLVIYLYYYEGLSVAETAAALRAKDVYKRQLVDIRYPGRPAPLWGKFCPGPGVGRPAVSGPV